MNQCSVPCLVLTVASCPVYRFLRGQVKWTGIPISLRIFHSLLSSLVAQSVKSLPAIQETQVWFLGWEDPLEKEMATPVFLPGEIHEQRSLAATVYGVARVGHDWATKPRLWKLNKIAKDRETWHATVHGVKKSQSGLTYHPNISQWFYVSFLTFLIKISCHCCFEVKPLEVRISRKLFKETTNVGGKKNVY